MNTVKNFFAIPGAARSGEELIEVVYEGPALRIERIVSVGHATPPGVWYDQPEDEWVVVLEGSAAIAYEDGSSIELTRGDHLFIPARCRHRVSRTSADPPCIWLALHMGL